MKKEKTIQASIIKYIKDLESKGYPVYIERRSSGGPGYKMGSADLFIVYNGKHVEVEVKNEIGELKPLQEKWRSFCVKNHISYILARSLDDIKKIIK